MFGSLLKIWMVMDFHSILCPLQIKCKLHGQQDVFFFGKLCSSSKSMRSEGLMRCKLWVWTSEDSPVLSLYWIFPSKQVWCSWNYKSWSLMTTWNIPYSTCATCYVTGHLTFLIVEKILKRYKYFFKTNIIRRSLTQNCRIINYHTIALCHHPSDD